MQGNNPQTGALQQVPKKPAVIFEDVLKESFIDRQLESALSEKKGAFVTSLVELYTGDKSLQSCNPKLVAMEAIKAAALDLPISKALGFAYIVVYNNSVKTAQGWQKVPTPTFVLGYKGYIQLAERTGQYRTINATPVYEGEFKKRDRLTGDIDISGTKTSDKVVGYAGYIEYLNGFSKAEYMTVEEMAKHALRFSPSMPRNMKLEDIMALANKEPEGKKVGWLGNFNDMAVKTIIRRLISKYGYMSIQMQTAVQNDSSESFTALPTRNETLAEEANTEEVNLDTVDYEDVSNVPEGVDPETGEVKSANDVANEPASEEAPY